MPDDSSLISNLRELVEKPINWGIDLNQAIQSVAHSKLGRDTGNLINSAGHVGKEFLVAGFDALVQNTAAGVAQFANHKDSPEAIKEKVTLFKPEDAPLGSGIDLVHKTGAIASLFIPLTVGAKVIGWGAGIVATRRVAAIANVAKAYPTMSKILSPMLDFTKPTQQMLAAGGIFSFLQPVQDSHNQLPERLANGGITVLSGAFLRSALGATGYGAGSAEAAKMGFKATTLDFIQNRVILAGVAIPTSLMATQLHAFKQGKLSATSDEYIASSLSASIGVLAFTPPTTSRLLTKVSMQGQKPGLAASSESTLQAANKGVINAKTTSFVQEHETPTINQAKMPTSKRAGIKIEPDANMLQTFRYGDQFRNQGNIGADGKAGSLINSPFGKVVAQQTELPKLRARVTTTGVPALGKSIERVLRPPVEPIAKPVRSFSDLVQTGDIRPQFKSIAVRPPVSYSLDPKYGNANNVGDNGEAGSLSRTLGTKASVPVKLEYGEFGKGIKIGDSIRAISGTKIEAPANTAKQRTIRSIFKPGPEFGNQSNIPSADGKTRDLRFSYLGEKAMSTPTLKLTSKRGGGDFLSDRVAPMEREYFKIANPRYTGPQLFEEFDPRQQPRLKASKAGDVPASPFTTTTTSLLRKYQVALIGNIDISSRYFNPFNTGSLTEKFQDKIQPPCYLAKPLDFFPKNNLQAQEVLTKQGNAAGSEDSFVSSPKISGGWHDTDAINKGLAKEIRSTKNPSSAIKPGDIWLGKNSKAASENIQKQEAKINHASSRDTARSTETKISSPKVTKNSSKTHAERVKTATEHRLKLSASEKPGRMARQASTRIEAEKALEYAQVLQKAKNQPAKIELGRFEHEEPTTTKPSIFKPYKSENNIPAFDKDTNLTIPGGLSESTLSAEAVLSRPVLYRPGVAGSGKSLADSCRFLDLKAVPPEELAIPTLRTCDEALGMLRLKQGNPDRPISSRLSTQDIEAVKEIPQELLPQTVGKGLEVNNPRYESNNNFTALSEKLRLKIEASADK